MDKFKDIIEKVEKLSVLELAELVKALEEKFGVSALRCRWRVPRPSAYDRRRSPYNVVLKAGGDQKINVIKAIKEATGLGLQGVQISWMALRRPLRRV